MAENGCNWLVMTDIAGYGWKWLDMAGNGLKWLELA